MSTAKLASIETPEKAASRLAKAAGAAKKGIIVKGKLHDYRDAAGNPVYWRIRIDLPSGAKWIRPMWFDGSAYVLGEPPFPNGKPLFNLDHIASRGDATVIITEGEKKAEELAALGLLVTTSGAADSAAKADWTPLAGRRVVIWPDNDLPGQRYAANVAKALSDLGCEVSIIDASQLGLKPKGDASDWLALHPEATADAVLALPRMQGPSAQVAATTVASGEPGLCLINGASIELEPVRWLWPGYLPAGMLTILGGAPGCGKTTIALSLAANLTRAGVWPCGRRVDAARNVLIWSGEDGHGVLAARLRAAGADMAKVSFVGDLSDGSPFDPGRDLDLLTAAAEGIPDLGMLVIDPIVSVTAGDSHKGAEVRRDLRPLVGLAHRVGCAVFGITHFTKGTAGRDPVERITGSHAFAALARLVLVAAKVKAEDGESAQPRALMRAKSNIGPDDGGFLYQLDQREVAPGVEGQMVVWGKPIDGQARAILAEAEAVAEPSSGSGESHAGTASDAADALRRILGPHTMPYRTVIDAMRLQGFSEKQARGARERLCVVVKRTGFGADMVSYWKLPPGTALPEDEAAFVPSAVIPAHSCPVMPSADCGRDLGTSGAANQVAASVIGNGEGVSTPADAFLPESCPPMREGRNGHEWAGMGDKGRNEPTDDAEAI